MDLISGDNYQFAVGREDTLQIQHLTALTPASSVNLFYGSSGHVALGGPSSGTLVEGAEISIAASNLLDITLTARGSALTFNQVGQESLVGFAPTVTSIVAALNDVKSAVGMAGLQGAYDIGNLITMTSGRNLMFTTRDISVPADLLVRNTLGRNFIRTDTANNAVLIGDGANLYTTISGHVNDWLWFENTNNLLFGYWRELVIDGTPAGCALDIRGRCNDANTAGADVWIAAERNTAGTRVGGIINLSAYEGQYEAGPINIRSEFLLNCEDGSGYSELSSYVNDGFIYLSSYRNVLDTTTVNSGVQILSEKSPIYLMHDGNAAWEFGPNSGTFTYRNNAGRRYLYVDDYYLAGRVGLGSHVWPVVGHGQYFRNLIGTYSPVALPAANQSDVVLLSNARTGGPDSAGLCVWNANPNGVCYAPRGSVLLRTDTGSVYVNTDDAAAWSPLGMGIDTLQAAYDTSTGGGVQIGMTDLGKDLIIETKDTATYRNFILRKQDDSLYLQTDAQNSTLQLGNTTGPTPVNVLLDSNLSWVRDANDRRVSLYNESLVQKRTLTIEATRGVANQYGGDLKLWADGSAAHPDATGGGQVELASKVGGVTRSYLQLNQNGDTLNYGTYLSSYGRVELVVDLASAAGSQLNLTNTRGPTTLTSTGGTLTVNATGQTVSLDCTVLDVDATSASHVASATTLSVSAVNDLTLGARGATITLNQLGEENLDPGFASTSIIGALNELLGSGGAGTLQQSYNLGNTIGMTTARSVIFTTFDGAGVSNFVVQNTLGRIFLQTDTTAGSVRLGDTLLSDVVLAARGGSLTFNQVGNVSLVGFAPATTSIVAALNELKASPSGGVTAIYTTAEAITAGDVVYCTAAGTIGVADQSVVGKEYTLGFSTQSVGAGAPCVVALAGEVTVKTTLVGGDVGLSAFLDVTGNVTTTPPGAGALARIGMVVASGVGTSKVAMQIGPVVIL
jgi:hypothetical protein